MHVFAFIVPIISLLAGAGGYILRRIELETVFDPITDLPERGAEITFWLIILSAAFLLIISVFAIVVSRKRCPPDNFSSTFSADKLFYPISMIFIGLVWIGGAFMHLISLLITQSLEMVDLYFLLVSVLSAISIIVFAMGIYRNPNNKRLKSHILSIIPIAFFCFWLILLYSDNAANPILLSYVYQCFAVAASILSFYYTSGFLFLRPALGRAIVAYSIAIYFHGVALADNAGMGPPLVIYAAVAFCCIHLFMLLWNLYVKPPEAADNAQTDDDVPDTERDVKPFMNDLFSS